MALIDALADVATRVAGLSGMTGASHEPPQTLPSYPYAVVYAGDGQIELVSGGDGGFGRFMGNIVVEILQGQVNPLSVSTVSVWPERLYPLLTADLSLGGTVEHIIWPVTYQVVNIDYGAGEIYAGCRLVIPVKLIL